MAIKSPHEVRSSYLINYFVPDGVQTAMSAGKLAYYKKQQQQQLQKQPQEQMNPSKLEEPSTLNWFNF